jgi:heptaprenyl diphosphate synthase
MKQLLLPPDLLTDLQQVDRIVLQRVQSHAAVITVAGQHLLNSGGKRLRAALTLVAAQLGTYNLERVLHAATAVEVIHAASLVHDDLVDEAERRRGTVTMRADWDHDVALMVGDYLFAIAAGEMALAPDSRIITYLSEAVMTICEGELAPVMRVTPLETALEQYHYKVGSKTAALFAAACKCGIASGGGTPEQIDALGQFGYDLGLAFQIMDDILDFTGDESALGKPAGGDLRQGIITLPLIYAVDSGGGMDLAAVIDTPDESRIAWAIAQVQRLGIDRAQAEAQHLVERALNYLAPFPDSPARRTLGTITEFVLERKQ